MNNFLKSNKSKSKISLPRSLFQQIRAKAARQGMTFDQYVEKVIARDLDQAGR